MLSGAAVPPGAAAPSMHCARCKRRIGTHLSYPDPDDVRTGQPLPRRICYRCHREATRGRLPPLLGETPRTGNTRPVQFLLYRVGMVVVAGCTLAITALTREPAYFLYGLGGVLVLYALGRAVHPRRRRRTDTAEPSETSEDPPRPR